MSKNSVFSDQELKELQADTRELIKEAIDAGDITKAKALTDRLYNEFTFIHDGYMCWASSLMTHIYKKYGIKALEEAEMEAHMIEGKLALTPPENDEFRTVVKHTASALHGHVHQAINIEEDDEKAVITVSPCGSGGRIIQKGWYEDGAGLAKVKEPSFLTWGMTDFPIYCVHCPAMEVLSLKFSGQIKWVHEVSETGPQGASCKFIVYKNPEEVPEKYFNRIGYQKPMAR